ncbi:MAG: excinuclease ABC subunit UvrC [bacterium]
MNFDEKLGLLSSIKELPTSPGVYIFKDHNGQVVYIGKAKNLKARVSSYVQKDSGDIRVETIMESAVVLEHVPTATELEAMLLEAKLIRSHQPKHNILLKSGQPFLYIMVTNPVRKLPELKLVRNRDQKGIFFGPFLEKMPARKVFDFLVKTFRLKVCGKKIENGCLYYHLGICSGSCRPDFDQQAYLDRLELAKKALKQGHKKFLEYLEEQIAHHNTLMNFEKSRELYDYLQAFQRVFATLDIKTTLADTLAYKEIWIVTPEEKALFVFSERDSVLRKKQEFYFPFESVKLPISEYFTSYYHSYAPASTILVNFDFSLHEKELFEKFLTQWYERKTPVSIIKPDQGHYAALVRMAEIQVAQELEKKASLAVALKRLLKLSCAPQAIDCFDVSHKQGMWMVGSCVRFTDGKPDKDKFRRFKIKTVQQQDDYACLHEIVQRRYKDSSELPDLIVIDGGKGQLSAVGDICKKVECVALAKREETIFSKHFPQGKILNQKSYAAQVLIALRDYAHHFAISYHRTLERM